MRDPEVESHGPEGWALAGVLDLRSALFGNGDCDRSYWSRDAADRRGDG